MKRARLHGVEKPKAQQGDGSSETLKNDEAGVWTPAKKRCAGPKAYILTSQSRIQTWTGSGEQAQRTQRRELLLNRIPVEQRTLVSFPPGVRGGNENIRMKYPTVEGASSTGKV